MKKSKILAMILSVLFITSALSVFPVSAMSEGFPDLAGASQGKNPLMNPTFIDGGKGYSDKESAASLFVYDEKSEDYPKYCASITEHGVPYWAEWQYDKAYIVNRIIFRTGGDSELYPRRMGDGYTISGSTDGTTWNVIYTGKEDDTDAKNDMYYYIDLPDNKTAYQYYKLSADKAGVSKDNGGVNDLDRIQSSMLILCGDAAPAATEAAAVTTAAAAAGDTQAETTAAASDNGGSGSNIWLWVGIGAAVVIIIIVVAVLLTKKKKPEAK